MESDTNLGTEEGWPLGDQNIVKCREQSKHAINDTSLISVSPFVETFIYGFNV